MITEQASPQVRVRHYARMNYTLICTGCPDLLIHAEGAPEAGRIIEAHRRDCSGEMIAQPRARHT